MAQAGKWKDLVPAWPVQTVWWSAEQLRELEEYMRRAEASRRRGQWEDAVSQWEEALARLPDIPEPRRRQLQRHIRETLEQTARAALERPSPDGRVPAGTVSHGPSPDGRVPDGPGLDRSALDWSASDLRLARRCLERAARSTDDPGVFVPLGLLLHLTGKPAEALEWYDRLETADPAARGDFGRSLVYARRLAQLQLAVARRHGATAALTDLTETEAWRREGLHPLEVCAWRRLAALAALAAGDAGRALDRFPSPDHPDLPAAWALEGALVAALQGDWPRCLAYCRRAQREGASLTGEPHLYVFAAAWLSADDGRTQGDALAQDVPFPAASLRERAPRHLFTDDTQYRAWRRHFLRWQYRWWLYRARAALERGDDRALQQSLAAATRLLPKARLSRAIDAWRACAYGGSSVGPSAGSSAGPSARLSAGGSAPSKGLARGRDGRGVARDGLGADSPAFLRVAVWSAERYGTPADVVRELNRLLEREPGDPWGLARWKGWMMRLGQEAMAQGRWRQALLQFVSLLLRLPDDEDGWRWCGRLHAELGNAARARDCLSHAERLAKARSRGWGQRPMKAPRPAEGIAFSGSPSGPGRPDRSDDRSVGAPEGQHEVEYGLLRDLLYEVGDEPAAAVPPFAFSKRALLQAVWTSVRSADAYLEFLLKEWVRKAGSRDSAG